MVEAPSRIRNVGQSSSLTAVAVLAVSAFGFWLTGVPRMKFSILLRIVGSGGGAGATDGTADGLTAAVRVPTAGAELVGRADEAVEVVAGVLVTDPVVAGALAVVKPLEPQPASTSPAAASVTAAASPRYGRQSGIRFGIGGNRVIEELFSQAAGGATQGRPLYHFNGGGPKAALRIG